MRQVLALLMILVGTTGCLTLDGFWFDPEPLDEYTLPDNEVPDAQLEPVVLQTSDGETIYGFYATHAAAARADTTILYCHGNYQHLDHYWPRVMILWNLGYDVFAFDYRGYGRSTGEATEAGIYEDGRTVLAWLSQQPRVQSGALVYYGYSLGGAVAIQLATEQTPDALFTESAFASAQALLEDSANLPMSSDLLMDGSFDNLGKIGSVTAPYLAFHGTEDDFIRFEFSELLVERANDPKKLVPAEGAGHGEPSVPDTLGDVYGEQIDAWIDDYVVGS